MKLSKFVKIYPLDDIYAYYHSLKMRPVYLNETEHLALQNGFFTLRPNVIKALKENMILVEDDSNVLDIVQKSIPKPYVCLAYFILTEHCNLACNYCFLGNGNKTRINTYPMNRKTADGALKYFAFQTQQDSAQFNDEKEIMFYGGEPLLNFPTLQYIVNRSSYYIQKGLITSNLKFSIVTNGLLLNKENISFLKEHDVYTSLSIDGATKEDNCNRVDIKGNDIYEKLIEKLSLIEKMNFSIGLSITLTESLLNHMDDLINLLTTAKIQSVCFNILHIIPDYYIQNDYYEKATDFIIKFYEKTIDIPVYEDRFARKLNTFINGGIYYSDCAATSGNQIVISPSGSVGICHGCLETHDYFFTNIYDYKDIRFNVTFNEWSKLSPVFQKECIQCEALGMCGGGCPINAVNSYSGNNIHSIDRTFCTHSKKILEYLIRRLYIAMKRNQKQVGKESH